MGIDISKQMYCSDAMLTDVYSEEVPQVSYRKPVLCHSKTWH